MRKRNIFLFVVATTIIVYYITSAHWSKENFDVVMLKQSGERIFDVRVSFDGFPMFRFGDLTARESERGRSIFMMHRGVWPSEVSVHWKLGSREEDAIVRNLRVNTPFQFRSDETLELVIEFKENDVLAYPRVKEPIEKGLQYRYHE